MEFVDPTDLYTRYAECRRVRIDSREVAAGDLFCGLRGSRVDGNRYAAAALERGARYAIVDDPEVVDPADGRYLLVADALAAIQDLAHRHRAGLRTPVFALTGSNGKTTTKELIATVMSRQYVVHATPGNFNNHLGLPLTILAAPPNVEFLLLEMGANHRGEIAELCRIARPTHGLVTNVGEAHLEGFGGLDGVIRGKGELYDYLADPAHRGVAFVNDDESHLQEMARNVARVIHFRSSDRPSPETEAIEIVGKQLHPTLEVAFRSDRGELIDCRVALSGAHNFQNLKAAIAVGRYFKVPTAQIIAGLENYRPANHRSQWIEHRGVRFYWDAYNANPSSVAAALDGFSREVDPTEAVVVLGEMLELGEIAPAAHRRVVFGAGRMARTVILVGAAMREIAEEFGRPHFPDSRALHNWFWEQDWSGRTVFVKGSRGNRLEVLLEPAD